MFTWLNKQGVKSDRGFVVQVIDRYTIEYREESRTLSVPVDFGFSASMKPCVILKKDAISCWDNGESLSDGKKKEIFDNFCEAMKFQKMEVAIE